MLSPNHPVSEIAKGLLDVPFNDFEMFHNPEGTGTVERGGSCIFLTNEFLRRLPDDQKAMIVAAVSQVHYATVLEIEGQEYFYDPFLRMEQPVPLPQAKGELVEFPGNPQDIVKKIGWRLVRTSKRGKQKLETHVLRKINGSNTDALAHIYRAPLRETTPMKESDLTYERKGMMDIEVFEDINGVLRSFSFRYRFAYDHVPMSAYSSGGNAGHSDYIGATPGMNYGKVDFVVNLAPILGRLKMGYKEFMEYVEHAAETRRRLREIRFTKDRLTPPEWL